MLEIVRVQIQQHLTAVARLEECVLREYNALSAKKHSVIDRQMRQVRQAQSRSKKLLDGLYQDLTEGVISRDEYTSMKADYREQYTEYDQKMTELEEGKRALERYGSDNPMFNVCRSYYFCE